MTRSLLILSGVVGSLLLAGCATQSGAPSSNDAYATKPAAAAPAPAAAAPAAPATAAAPALSDADLAASLKGEWVGDWQFPGFGGGKFVLRVTSVEGTSLKGDAELYGTANGDVKLPLSKATVKDGVLIAEQPNTVYTLRKKDEKSLAGTWAVGAYSGPLTAKR